MKWNNIEEGDLPELGTPPLLAIEPTLDLINECHLGRLAHNDTTNENGWFIGNDMHVITLASSKHWAYLIDEPIGIPQASDQNVLKAFLEGYMEMLSLYEKKF